MATFGWPIILLICFHFANLRCHNGIPSMDIIEILVLLKSRKLSVTPILNRKLKNNNYLKNNIENLN